MGKVLVMVFIHLFHAVLGCKLVSFRAEDRLGLIELFLRLDVLLELLLRLDTNALQVLPIRVEKVESLLKLWDLFISEVEDAS